LEWRGFAVCNALRRLTVLSGCRVGSRRMKKPPPDVIPDGGSIYIGL
jgi:hypothetical protein